MEPPLGVFATLPVVWEVQRAEEVGADGDHAHPRVPRILSLEGSEACALVRLPVDDRRGVDVCKIGLRRKSLYGTQDAASNWERDWQRGSQKFWLSVGAQLEEIVSS